MKIELNLDIEPEDEQKIHYMILAIVNLCDKLENITGIKKITIRKLVLESPPEVN